MLKKAILLTLLIALSAPAAGWADDLPRGKWWQRPSVAAQLALTAGEKGRMDDAYLDLRRRMIAQRGVVDTERLQLEVLIEQPQLDEQAVLQQYRKVEQARSELAVERFRFLIEVRKILGLERFRQATTFGQERRRDRHRADGGVPTKE